MIPIFFFWNFVSLISFPYWRVSVFFEKYLPQCYECDESFDYRKNWKSHLELVHQTIYYSSDDSEDEDTDDDFENVKKNKLTKNKSISRKELVKENINQAAAPEQKDKTYDTSNETSTTDHNNYEK